MLSKMQKLVHSFVLLFIITNQEHAFAGVCSAGDYAGKNNVKDEDKHKGSGTGNSIMMDAQDNEYTFDCCGYISSWQYYAKDNTGTVYFQVWRDTTSSISTWTLVGENQHSHTNAAKNTYTYTPVVADQILVQSGDVIGMHFPGDNIVTYDNGQRYRITTTYTTGSTTFDWSSISTGNNRDYGIKAILDPSSSPTIDNLDASVTFADGISVGTLLFILTVSDSDTSDTLTTSVTSNTGATLFDFNSGTLQVTTKAALSSGTYSMGFQVADLCGLTDTGTLTLTITNVPPTIYNLPGSYSLSEDQTAQLLLFTVNATDPSDTVTCSISSSNPVSSPFTMKSDKGIYVQSSPGLDYGTTTQYILTIQCTDTKDPVSDIFTVYVIPNIPPTIYNLPSSYSLSEDHVLEMLLYTLNVTDPTSDTITCSITNPVSSPFFIKPVSGTSDYGIYVEYSPSLDFNLISQYDLTVECADARTPVTGLYTVIIVKNEPPVFVNLDNTTTVSTLTTGIGKKVFQVSVTDNENDQLLFNMTCNLSTCPFSILASGDILATSNLYGTSVPSYDLYIQVYDGHTYVGPKTLTISVTDINNLPTYSNLPLASTLLVYENSALGSSILLVTVSDSNVGDTHTFTVSFSPQSGAQYFKLNSASGLLTLSSTNVVNYEALASTSFTVNISVSDGFAFISEAVDITIADVNEAPVFHKSYYSVSGNEDLATSEQYDPGFAVNDPDSGDSQIYTMDCGAYQAYFTIDSTSGNVTFEPGYDLDTGTNPSSISCNVTVSDGQYTDTAILEIKINQINDNLPQFSRPTYTFYISADDGIGTTVGNVSASDADAGIYGTISYSLDLTSLSCECFAVTNSGDMYVKESIVAFQSGAVFNFKAIATDGGNLQTTASITVIILQVTTTVSTTTTDRYITFSEDPRNSVWIVLVGFALFGWLCLMVYFTYSFGWLDNLFDKCSECAQRKTTPIRRQPQQRPFQEKTQVRHQRDKSHVTDDTYKADVRGASTDEQWEPWHTNDFINRELFSGYSFSSPYASSDIGNTTARRRGFEDAKDVKVGENSRDENPRFGPVVNSEDIRELVGSAESKNTRRNTNWAVKHLMNGVNDVKIARFDQIYFK